MKLPQLFLRDLFWLVALVAMGLGWWLDHREFSAPRVIIPRKVYDVGDAQSGHRGTVYFQLKNAGRFPVTITTWEESGEQQIHEIDVTEDFDVPCHWAAPDSSGEGLVLGRLEVLTSDPMQPRIEFQVVGNIVKAK